MFYVAFEVFPTMFVFVRKTYEICQRHIFKPCQMWVVFLVFMGVRSFGSKRGFRSKRSFRNFSYLAHMFIHCMLSIPHMRTKNGEKLSTASPCKRTDLEVRGSIPLSGVFKFRSKVCVVKSCFSSKLKFSCCQWHALLHTAINPRASLMSFGWFMCIVYKIYEMAGTIHNLESTPIFRYRLGRSNGQYAMTQNLQSPLQRVGTQ